MPTEFKLPELGENITSGDVIKVLVAPGDRISRDQAILELETDKATIEVPSAVSGTVADVRVKAGDKINVGQVILTVDDGAAPKETEAQSKETEAPAEDAFESGRQEHVAPEREEAPEEGAPRAAAERESVEAANAARSEEEQAEQVQPPQAAQKPARPAKRGEVVDIRPRAAAESEQPRPVAPAGPSVRRMARELGIDVNDVQGSGPAGRIGPDDVKAYARSVMGGRAARDRAIGGAPLPDFTRWGAVERKPMHGVRRKTAAHLSQAWTIPHVTQHDRADITALDRLRQRYEKKAEEAGGKLTLTAIAVKVAASAVKVFPQFNASVDMAAEEIIYKKYVHVGVAVDTERGLLVPVIRDADHKNVIDIAVELAELAGKARNKKLALEEMEGGTFTITNLGGIGGRYFSPIINAPEVAILGMSRATLEPVHVEGRFEPRLLLPLSLSYDHRLIDGADAIRFLRWIADALEQPFLLALQG